MQQKIYGRTGKAPTWKESAIATFRGLARSRPQRDGFTLDELSAYAEAHWDAVCWSHRRRGSDWRGEGLRACLETSGAFSLCSAGGDASAPRWRLVAERLASGSSSAADAPAADEGQVAGVQASGVDGHPANWLHRGLGILASSLFQSSRSSRSSPAAGVASRRDDEAPSASRSDSLGDGDQMSDSAGCSPSCSSSLFSGEVAPPRDDAGRSVEPRDEGGDGGDGGDCGVNSLANGGAAHPAAGARPTGSGRRTKCPHEEPRRGHDSQSKAEGVALEARARRQSSSGPSKADARARKKPRTKRSLWDSGAVNEAAGADCVVEEHEEDCGDVLVAAPADARLVLAARDQSTLRWIDSAVAVWLSLVEEHPGRDVFLMEELIRRAAEDWDKLCWPYNKQSRWQSTLRRVIVNGHVGASHVAPFRVTTGTNGEREVRAGPSCSEVASNLYFAEAPTDAEANFDRCVRRAQEVVQAAESSKPGCDGAAPAVGGEGGRAGGGDVASPGTGGPGARGLDQRRLVGEHGGVPTWLDIAIGVWRECAAEHAPRRASFSLTELTTYADRHWTTFCWSHLRHGQWCKMMQRAYRHGTGSGKRLFNEDGRGNYELCASFGRGAERNRYAVKGKASRDVAGRGFDVPRLRRAARLSVDAAEEDDDDRAEEVCFPADEDSNLEHFGRPVGTPRRRPVRAAAAPPLAGDAAGVNLLARGGEGADEAPSGKLHAAPAVDLRWIERPAGPVRLSAFDRAPGLVFPESDEAGGLSVLGHKGFRSVRATHGACEGSWYFEVTVLPHDGDGAVRIGWGPRRADICVPVGSVGCGYGIRDRTGEFVCGSMLTEYGEPFGVGDVVGCRIHLPDAVSACAREKIASANLLWLNHRFAHRPEPAPPGEVFKGAFVEYFKNGASMGVPSRLRARDAERAVICADEYYPTVSLFKNAHVRVNFGPFDALPACCRPVCDLAVPRAESAAGGNDAGGVETHGRGATSSAGDRAGEKAPALAACCPCSSEDDAMDDRPDLVDVWAKFCGTTPSS
jgi:hypothetical protein